MISATAHQPTLPSHDTMYRALVERDASYDGLFFACVRSTGIFCRPTCPARKPRRENVEFVATADDARRLGYRACRRCDPENPSPVRPRWVDRLIDHIEQHPEKRLSDADLRRLEIDPSRARRYFRNHYGMTFHAYHRSHRLGRALECIHDGGDLLAAGDTHGYQSDSGFRTAFVKMFGTSPGRARNGCPCLLAQSILTPLGTMLAVASNDGLCLLEFPDRRAINRQIESLRRCFDAVIVPGRNQHLDSTRRELAAYFDGTLQTFRTTVDVRGTPFQIETWNALRTIPYGQTMSYAQLAERIGRPGSARAVGRANGDNRLAIIVPCHRVIRADGQLSGYGGGLWRKRWLLAREVRG